MDDYNREDLAFDVTGSLLSVRVVHVLELVIEWRGKPRYHLQR